MKLILSERELEIIKQKEYKRGWYECDMAHVKSEQSRITEIPDEYKKLINRRCLICNGIHMLGVGCTTLRAE